MSPDPDELSFSQACARFRAVITRHFQLEFAYLGGAILLFIAVKGTPAFTAGLLAIGALGGLLYWRLGQIGDYMTTAARDMVRVRREPNPTEASKGLGIYGLPYVGPLLAPLILSLLLAHLAVSVGASVWGLVRVFARAE